MAIFGLQSGVQSSFLGLGQAKISLLLHRFEKSSLLIPLALILPHFFGVMGVYYAEPIADVCSVITAVTLFLCNIRKNSFNGNTCKSNSYRRVTKEALCDLSMHHP